MKKMLLSSILRPLGPRHGDAQAVSFELFQGQITVAQGAFSPRTTLPHFALDYIATNLDTPAVVLQYPTKREFIRELKRGNYDYVGISFNMCTFHKARVMSALVRQYAPKAKIILGGYGTLMDDATLLPYTDYICRVEGVAFMRELLHQPPKPLPYEQPFMTIAIKACHLPIGINGIIFGTLGCPNGCEFCSTSALFKSKSIRLLPQPEDVLNVIERYRAKNPTGSATIFDEEFLQDPAWSRRFLQLVRDSGKTPYPLLVLSSLRSIAKFTPLELIEMGVDILWVGYEGKRSGFPKQKVEDARATIATLRAHGIKVLVSYIMGFDYHTVETVREEVNEVIDLNVAFYQFLIYLAAPGTPFWQRAKDNNLFRPGITDDMTKYLWKCTGFYSLMDHPSIAPDELEKLQMESYRQEFARLGPSLLRGVGAMLEGHRQLKNDPRPNIQGIAARYRREILTALPMFWTARHFGPTPEARQRVAQLYQEVKQELNVKLSIPDALKSVVFFIMWLITTVTMKLDLFEQSRMMRRCYRNADQTREPSYLLPRTWLAGIVALGKKPLSSRDI